MADENNHWLRAVLARIEDHILDVRRFMHKSQKRWEHNEKRWEHNEKRWEHNEKRWQATHKLLVHMVEEIRKLKASR